MAFGNGLLLGSTSAQWWWRTRASCVYDHLQSLPLSWHQERKRGEILALLVNDVWWINSFLTGVLAPLLPVLVTCVGALILLVRIDLRVGLAVAVGVPLFTLMGRLPDSGYVAVGAGSPARGCGEVRHGRAEPGHLAFDQGLHTRRRGVCARSAEGDKVRMLEVRQQRIESLLDPGGALARCDCGARPALGREPGRRVGDPHRPWKSSACCSTGCHGGSPSASSPPFTARFNMRAGLRNA